EAPDLFRRGHVAEELRRLAQAEAPRPALERPAVRAVADDPQLGVGQTPPHFRERVEQHVDALVPAQPAEERDHRAIGLRRGGKNGSLLMSSITASNLSALSSRL